MNFISIFFGLVSGLIFDVNTSGLNFCFSKLEINYVTLGVIYATCFPYALSSFLYPVILRLRLHPRIGKFFQLFPLLIICQIILACLITCIGYCNLKISLHKVMALSFCIASFQAIQDSLFANFRIAMKESKQAAASSTYVIGYRIGMIIASCIIMLGADFMSWNKIFFIFGAISFSFPVFTFFIYKTVGNFNDELLAADKGCSFETFSKQIISLGLKSLAAMFLISFLFRATNNMIIPMLNNFLLQKGFFAKEIMLYSKWLGSIGSLIGSFIAHYFLVKFSVKRVMIFSGLLTSFLQGLWLMNNIIPHSIIMLICATLATSIASGMGMSAYTAFITKFASERKIPALYPICQSFLSMSRAIFPIFSGIIIINFGWGAFFIVSIALGTLFTVF